MKMLPLIAWLILPTLVTSNCIWYGACGVDDETGKALNCKYDGEASEERKSDQLWPNVTNLEPLDALTRFTFQQLCPHMSNLESTCCSDSQVTYMEDSFFLVEALLGR